nr:GPCR kinase [Tanacetum cinerariifolium]
MGSLTNPNVTGYLIVTLKDLSGIIHGTICHKVIDEDGYGKEINVGAALILTNVLVFSLKSSMHYLNITMRNVLKVFYKCTVPRSGSGVGGRGMLMKEEEIVKLMEEKEIVDLELQVCGNVTNQDEKALNLALEEKARKAWAEHEWLEKCRMTNSKNQRLIIELEALGEQGDVAEGGGALGANKVSTHLVIAILEYTIGAEVEEACALEVKAIRALDLVEVKASCLLGALDVVEAIGPLDLMKVEASCLLGPLDVMVSP